MKDRFAFRLMIVAGVCCAGALRASVSGTLDPPSGSGWWHPAGDTITVTATPGAYSQLTRWDGDVPVGVGTNLSFILTADSSKSVTAVFGPEVTSVGSGSVPHYWLAAMDSSSTNDFESAATADWDDDGFTNEQEYWSGTDPMNADSRLEFSEFVRTADGVRLGWSHAQVDSRIPALRVEGTVSMNPSQWEYVGEVTPGDGTIEFPVLSSLGYRFFRLRAGVQE